MFKLKYGIWLAINGLSWIILQLLEDHIMGKINEWIETTAWYKVMLSYIGANPWLLPAVSTFVLGVYIILRSARKPNINLSELANDMDIISKDIAQFLSERQRYDRTLEMPYADLKWSEKRKHEEWQRQTQKITNHHTETMSIYRERFAGKVMHLVEEAKRLGYMDEELNRYYEYPTNTLGIESVSNRMKVLALRMQHAKK